jgi:hypothetical protein
MHFYLWTEPSGQNNAYFKYVEILSPKALVPEVIAVPEKPLVIDLFSNVPEPSSIPEENVIAEEHISTVKLS